MPGAALGALVADDHDVARRCTCLPRIASTASSWDSKTTAGPAKVQQLLVDAGGLDDAPSGGEVAAQDRQAAVDGVGVLDVADAAARPRRCPASSQRFGRARTPRWCARRRARRGTARRASRTARRRGRPTSSSHSSQATARAPRARPRRSSPAAAQLAEDRRDAAGPVHVLHVVVASSARPWHRHGTRREIASMSAQAEVDLGLLGGGEQVQHRVGGAAHRDVERHRVLEAPCGWRSRGAAPTSSSSS